MDWKKETIALFNKFIDVTPDTFKNAIKPALKKHSEEKALQRNASRVDESDLILALIDIVPKPFLSEVESILSSMSIDINRYIYLNDIREKHKSDWNGISKAFAPGNYSFNLYLTDRCNQNCLHCAANMKKHRSELSTNEWKAIIEDLETTLAKQGRRGVYIWFGGEPTVREDIKELIQYCGDKDYYQAIATNGILFTNEFARFCASNKMSHVFISLDSINPNKIDTIRGRKDSLEAAKHAINNALENGLFVITTTTVMKQNINELDEIKKFSESLGAVPYIRAVIKQRNAAKNWDEIGLSVDEYKKFYDFRNKHTFKQIKQGKIGVASMCMLFDMVPFMEHPDNDEEIASIEWGVGCQACKGISGIDVNGDFFPCDFPSNLILGNVLEKGFTQIMGSQIFKDIRDRRRTGKCENCHHINFCGGGCRVHAESETGDFFDSFQYCWHDNNHQ